MPVVEVQLPADELAQRMMEMRAWLARRGAPAVEITHTKASARAVARVTLFVIDAEAFATRFGGRVVEG